MLFLTTSMIWCQVEPSDDMFVNVFFCSLEGKWSECLQVSGTSGCITFIRGALAVNMDMTDWTKKLVIIVNKILLIILIFCNFLDATNGHSKFYSAWLTVCSVSLTDDWPELATSAHCGCDCSNYFITPMVIWSKHACCQGWLRNRWVRGHPSLLRKNFKDEKALISARSWWQLSLFLPLFPAGLRWWVKPEALIYTEANTDLLQCLFILTCSCREGSVG